MSHPTDRQSAPRSSPLGVLSALVLFAGCAVVMLGIIWLDSNTDSGIMLSLIGTAVTLLGMAGLTIYLRIVRPR